MTRRLIRHRSGVLGEDPAGGGEVAMDLSGVANCWATAASAGRHMALAVFACAVASAAWPPAREYSVSTDGGSAALSLGGTRVVAQATWDATRYVGSCPAPALNANSPVVRYLPAGVVAEYALDGPAMRLTAPWTAVVAATGVSWVTALLVGSLFPVAAGHLWDGSSGTAATCVPGSQRNVRPPRVRQRAPSQGTAKPRDVLRTCVWALRYAAGAAALGGCWFCVYSVPREVGGALYTEGQLLHVAGAALGVYLATVLITFD